MSDITPDDDPWAVPDGRPAAGEPTPPPYGEPTPPPYGRPAPPPYGEPAPPSSNPYAPPYGEPAPSPYGPPAPPPYGRAVPPPPPHIPAPPPYGSVLPGAASRARRPDQVLVIVGVVVGVLVGLTVVGYGVDVALRHSSGSTPGFVSRGLSRPPAPVGVPAPGPPSAAVRAATMTADRTADGTVVNTAVAKTVLGRYWPLHEQALVGRDLSALRLLSAGPARRWQQAAVACGCEQVNTVRPLLDASYLVPRQTTYPASFVAEAGTRYLGQNWVEVLVFTKRAAGAPWLVTEDSGYGPPAGKPALGAPVPTAQGYDEPVQPNARRLGDDEIKTLAMVWQQAKDTGRIPRANRFYLGPSDGERRIASLAAHPQDTVQDNGLIGHFTFSVSRSDPLVTVTQDEDVLACRPIRETVRYSAPQGRVVEQNQARQQWGPWLAPGTYRQVVSRDVWQTCVLVPDDISQRIGILDHDVGGSRVTAAGKPPGATA